MTEEELKSEAVRFAEGVAMAAETFRVLICEIRRLRSELASERATHQELWQLVDCELDRIYCEQKGIEQ